MLATFPDGNPSVRTIELLTRLLVPTAATRFNIQLVVGCQSVAMVVRIVPRSAGSPDTMQTWLRAEQGSAAGMQTAIDGPRAAICVDCVCPYSEAPSTLPPVTL